MTELFNRICSMVSDGQDKIILSDKEGEYGIIETWDISGRVYSYLVKHGIGQEDIVLIFLPRSARSVMTAIGVWRAGAAVTIHEDWNTKEWIDFVKTDTGCKLVIDSDLIEDILKTDPLDGWKEPDLHDLAYITYTTGSTGERKGVMHEYGTIHRLIENFQLTASGWTTPTDYRISIVITLHSAISSIIYSIVFCSYLDIVPYEIVLDFGLFKERLIEKRILYTYASPSMLEKTGCLDSTFLECIGTSFEPATNTYSSSVPLINEYGMTESGTVLAEFVIDKPYEIVPIGKPIKPDETFILDRNGSRISDGEIGEICFVNQYCRGYLNKPEATAAQFRDGLFHTRDLGKILPDGKWLMLGRVNDSIMTPSGLVVALEIEASARKVMDYHNIYVKVYDGSTAGRSDPVICVYADRAMELMVLRERLMPHLPEYKLPTEFMLVDSFRYNNGKVIRMELRNPYETGLIFAQQ